MKQIIVLLAISLLIFSSCSKTDDTIKENDKELLEEKIIGGERNEFGCLGAAGYTWNESVNACIRTWELDLNQRKAAKIAVNFVGYKNATTIISVTTATCQGCFVVELEQGNLRERKTATLNNWEAVN
ncbi:MAG: hypothetical protein KKB65_02380 [Nanoarchaeota archaeon]|nr:hypothetical protein [Nanoarchaeota archaeon]MBU1030058.1 hypothetical protein [Nanoarchaeota archaeon]MBU1850457.1 hypothetical protein [Nanoarchaeota archaeon]